MLNVDSLVFSTKEGREKEEGENKEVEEEEKEAGGRSFISRKAALPTVLRFSFSSRLCSREGSRDHADCWAVTRRAASHPPTNYKWTWWEPRCPWGPAESVVTYHLNAQFYTQGDFFFFLVCGLTSDTGGRGQTEGGHSIQSHLFMKTFALRESSAHSYSFRVFSLPWLTQMTVLGESVGLENRHGFFYFMLF